MNEQQNDNIIFLNLIYQNAQMGLIGIDTVLKRIENEKLAKLINTQRKEYEKFCREAKDILIKYGAREEEIPKVKEISSKVMSEIMSMGKDDKEIAKLMMEGNQKGVIEIQEKINNKKCEDSEIRELAKRLLETEEQTREELKKFL